MIKLSESAKAILERCWFANGSAASITIAYDETYIIDDKKHRATIDVVNEIVESGKVKVISKSNKYIVINGIG